MNRLLRATFARAARTTFIYPIGAPHISVG
jgi:hypothetical protein